MKGYLYKTECLVNGKLYIGISVNQKNKQNYLGSGIALKDAIKKYGKENFKKTILVDSIDSLEDLNRLEKEYIEKYNCLCPIGYNIDLGGKGNGNHSETTKKKISKTKTGIKHTKEHIAKNRESHLGLTLTNKTKNKISEANKGNTPWNKGKRMSKEFSEKVRNIMTGSIRNRKQIIFENTKSGDVKEFNGIVEAAEYFNVSNGTISNMLNQKQKTLKKEWKLVGVLTSEAQPIASGVGG